MNCPACTRSLSEMDVAGISVDVCDGGCGGIWFDNYELDKVDEQHEAAGERLLEIKRDPAVKVDHDGRRTCPRCDGQVMQRHFRSVKRNVEIDTCPGCAGVWLDAGELVAVRTMYKTDDQRKKATEDYFDEVFGAEFLDMKDRRDDRLQRSRRVARAFKFICPSYWLSGKQDWGAF